MDYAKKYSPIVDEMFSQESITEAAVNKDYDFVGAKTVVVHSVPTVAMNDYNRSGNSRYGVPQELENAEQELTMRRDRSFTFTVDKGNDADTSGELNAGKALNRQIKQVIVPEVDAYRLAAMARDAGTVVYGNYTGAVKAYERILDGNAVLDDAKVPTAGRLIYVTSAFRKKLQLDDSFIKASDMGQQMLIKGQIGEVDGLAVIRAPKGYLPAGVAFLITHPQATTAPHKLSEYKTHDNPPGINGTLVEGRDYYDAFVLNNKRACIYVLRSELAPLTVLSEAGTETGKTLLTITGQLDGTDQPMGVLCYKAAASQALPALGDDISAWTELPAGEITATNGHKIAVAARDEEGKAIAAGLTVVVSAA